MSDSEAGPVTLSVTRNVRRGREADFEAWAATLNRAARDFPGHLGIGVLRPPGGSGGPYTMVVRFASYRELRSWQESRVRAELLEQGRELIEGQPTEQLAGLEFWFTPPASPTLRQPPRWKMAALTVLALYPLNLLLNVLLSPLLSSWPLALRLLLLAVLVVVVMTYAVMPMVTRVFRSWLSPGGAG
ncbi:antibiotic biosynthesis monooxygenase [Deinococcus peraridilitoris]|uniref:ABM domain-containing protein n=1 Tax=Deinococcus peraridilitoris (strain DSM 19664 / LMG 22246 / CIP 109416 / KR-200) TaxID=937777 RepID=L0A2C1_DEIPD|nr:antibiotic biosynthesis monooxygenase [Deinococcus peraridilitoris]AFZ68048.1 hypothetical protein Deipe_2583 [Deinococcus peraridilitoris DSM 19664]